MALVGAEVKRKEDPRLITGTSAYVADIAVPGLHYVAFVRSPHAHARIRGIDASAAARMPGVRLVITGRDLRGHCAPIPLESTSSEGGGSANPDNVGRKHYPLSIDRVRHVGEAVAAVVAVSEEIAVDGAAAVVVDWDPLPAVADPFAAMAPGAPRLFDDTANNVEHVNDVKAGDPDGAFARAHRVIK
jgi:aerobic carbon-monoxide dehydrogenase large subunit